MVLRLLVGGGESGEQLLQQVAVGGGELVECGLLDVLARLLVARGPLAAKAELAQVEQPVRRFAVERDLLAEAAGRLVKLVDTLLQAAAFAELEHQLAAGRTERLVDAGEHAAEPVGAVDGEQAQTRRVVAGAELRQRSLERLAAQHAPLALVEHAETRIDTRSERMRAQQPVTEAVDR